MTESSDTFTPWTPDGATRLRAAAAALAIAVVEHADAVSATTSRDDFDSVSAATERLLPTVLAYAEAQFEYTGNGFPFGVLYEYEDDEAEDEGERHSEDPASGISVLQRRDYRVEDETAVLEAGRRAYLRVWPDDDEAAAAADVTYLGRALYQLAHADGWHSLDLVDGLSPVGGAIVVVRQDEPLGPDPDDWPEQLFDEPGDVLYEQLNVIIDG